MSKDDIIQYVNSQNGSFIGYFQVPFPVYVVHISYDSVDKDPFFPLEKAILRYVKSCPKMDKTPYFANLIGFDEELIIQCTKSLKEKGMIRIMESGQYEITNDAERKYLTPNSRPTVKVTGTFIVDGKSLNILPKFIYQGEPRLTDWEVNVSAHLPIDLSMNKAPGKKVIQYLQNSRTLEMLGLETTGSNFEVLEFRKKFLKGAYAVFYLDKQKQYHKDIVYGGHLLECDATGSATTYTIELKTIKKDSDNWNFIPNYGYNVSDIKGMYSVAIFAQLEGWTKILSERYKIKDYFFKIETEEDTKLPIIHIDNMLVLKSPKALNVIADAQSGYIDFPLKSQEGIVRIKTSHKIQTYIDFKETLTNWDKNPNLNGKEIANKLNRLDANWRQLMVKFELFEYLEKIDCDCFIFNKRNDGTEIIL